MGAMHEHHIEQGHKMHGRASHKMDGAGKSGHDLEIRSHTENKAPVHPMKPAHATGYVSPAEGVAGHPGDMVKLGEAGPLVGHSFKANMEPAVLKAPSGSPTAGHPGMHAEMSPKPHGFGHQQHQRQGVHRNSGHPGAHRLGKR
jgi:hypothetical protein